MDTKLKMLLAGVVASLITVGAGLVGGDLHHPLETDQGTCRYGDTFIFQHRTAMYQLIIFSHGLNLK